MTTVEDWLGADNTLGIDIWNKKYRYNNETFDEWLDRVTGNNDIIKKLILEKKFLFGGRILANRGTGKTSMTSNCFVLSCKDSIDSIYETAKNMALTYKAGGGVGIDISSLAPAGAKVNNPAKTSTGAVSFIELFTTTTGLIGQNGRRGALMVSIACDHPDVEEFIKLKTDVNKATTANLSIRVSDDFMKAVENDEDWYMSYTREETGECIYKTVKARDLFEIFCKANYDYGEPGLLYWDRIKNYNMLSTYEDFEFAGINPCFKGDTKILTKDGYISIEKLCDKETYIWNGYEWSYVLPTVSGYNQPMYRVEFSDGSMIECTDYHRYILADDSRVMCKDLKVGDKIKKFSFPAIEGYRFRDRDIAYTNGFFSGDGYYKNDGKEFMIDLYSNKKQLYKYMRYTSVNTNCDEAYKVYISKKDGMVGAPNKTFVPDASFKIETRLSWLAGLVDSDGTLNDVSGSIAITSINRDFLSEVKLMLNTLGVSATLIPEKDACMKFMPTHNPNKDYSEYFCKPTYRLVISASNVVRLVALGFHTHRVSLCANPNRDASRFIRIKSLTKIANEPVVYCMNEPLNHSVVANGIMTAQCGELPLPDGGACLLGSLNLAEFVKDGCFDYDDFGTAVKHAISALDVVQTEGIKYLPLEIQRKTAEEWRQLGLGIMGLGDMLIKMNIKYGSEESIELCERIGKIMAINAILESGRIGAYRKHFDKFDSDKTTSSPFWIANAGAKGCIMRNSQLLAIAPTGTISTMLGVSGGIEPLFALEYERTTKSLHGEDVKYTVIPDVVKEARDKGFTNGLVCAQDIPYQERIAMQAVWQKHIDGSISSTINLPNDFPEDQVKDIYMLAWKSGLKGITVFRDGCKRAGVLNTVNKEEVKLKDVDSVNLIGKKRKLMTGCGSLHCTAFFDKETGKFYELYLSKGSTGGCNNFMIGLSRMVSLSARSGCTVDEIIDQLNSCGACPSYAVRKATKGDTSIGSCCPTAVGFALKEMQEEMFAEIGKGSVKVGKPVNQIITINTNDNPCPQCGAKLSFTNGCATCMACGYSKCN